ncbi:MAG: aminopeptidase P family protein [Chitinophagaceae bacterium]|nr:aminopeptidase P family protein [Chitinophagaceae bacterium]
MFRKLLLLLLASPLLTQAQQNTEYPNDYLSPAFHAGRRAAFREMMPARSVALFFASQVRVRNNDVDFQFAQSKNFYYLTGLEEPNSLLLIFKEPVTILDKTGTEFLFVQPRNPQQEMWTGKILGVDGVKERYKFDNVFTHDKFNAGTIDFSKFDSVLSLFRQEDIVSKFKRVADPLSRMALITDSLLVATKAPMSASTRIIMSRLRGIKQPEEIALMEKVTNMSVAGHNEVMRTVKPGMTEYQAQAVMEYMFKKNGAEFVGYPSINGSGPNSCILHYETNQRLMKDGDLLLSDCAAEYHGYSADVTRTIPVNGKFTPEQKAIYEIVLEAQDSAFEKCRPGIAFGEVHAAAQRVITRGLTRLGIIGTPQEVRTYFPHGTSHHLGLDVHDLGSRGALEEGACFTVEPGIYIPPNSKCDPKWWNIGVRIEDDVLITKTGYRNLSVAAPRTVAEIEKMAKRGKSLEL